MTSSTLHEPSEPEHPPFRPLTPEQASLLEMSPNPKLVLDAQFRIRFVNRATAAYGSVERETLIGRNVWDCYPSLRGSIFHQAYARVLESGEPARFERHDHESDRWQVVYAYPADGGVIAVLEDITEQRRTIDRLRESEETLRLAQEAASAAAEERQRIDAQMQQAQKLESLGVLAGGIAHDFNNLLVGILGNASLALLEIDDNVAARECLHEVERAAQRAAELTRQLLAYAGKGRYVIEAVDATDTIHQMGALLRTASARTATISYELESALPRISVDINQFRQVVMTLVTNASDALGGKAGTVKVRTGTQELTPQYLARCVPGATASPGAHVFVEVGDSGSGMDADTVRRMFEPFFSTKFTGRGLGLAAAIGIMRSHDGCIHVESALGQGTTIRVLFPVRAS